MSMAEVLRKDQLEIRCIALSSFLDSSALTIESLHEEKRLIENGILKEDNPLDSSENFRRLCEACRRGDLKVCQEMITEGVNINAKDLFDYTPLILVSRYSLKDPTFFYLPGRHSTRPTNLHAMPRSRSDFGNRQAFVGTMRSSNCCSKLGHFAKEIRSKVKGGPQNCVASPAHR